MSTKKLISDLKKISINNKIKKSDLMRVLAKENLNLDDLAIGKEQGPLNTIQQFINDKYAHILRVEPGEHANDFKILPTEKVLQDLEFILKKQGKVLKIDNQDSVIHVK